MILGLASVQDPERQQMLILSSTRRPFSLWLPGNAPVSEGFILPRKEEKNWRELHKMWMKLSTKDSRSRLCTLGFSSVRVKGERVFPTISNTFVLRMEKQKGTLKD